MIERRKRFRALVLPIFVVVLGVANYARLNGTENIRAIHVVTLLTIGVAIGVLLSNIKTYIVKDRNKVQ